MNGLKTKHDAVVSEVAPQQPSPVLRFEDALHVREARRRLVYFGGCDYHRLSWHWDVRLALVRGLHKDGLSTAASRNTTGNHALYGKLESAIANFFQSETAVVLSSGYAANSVAAQALAGRFTHALIDRHAHGSLQDAARFLDAIIIPFQGGNPDDVTARLRQCGRGSRVILLTEGLFAQDGSAAPLRAYQERLPTTAWMLVDDAHGAGVLGPAGRGTVAWAGAAQDRLIQIITLSKAFGVYGGAVLGPAWVRDLVVRRSSWFSGNTPLPLPLAHACQAAIRLLARHPDWLKRLRDHTQHLKRALFDPKDPRRHFPGPIVSWRCSNQAEIARLKKALRADGIFPPFIRYPGGPPLGHFRFALSSAHSKVHVETLLRILKAHRYGTPPESGRELGPGTSA